MHLLRDLRTSIDQHVEVHSPGDRSTYSTGLPVSSRIALSAGGADLDWLQIWQPDPAHLVNQPRVVTDAHLADGSRKRIFIVTPGVIDAAPLLGDG